MSELRCCDCFDRCGDDPGVLAGRALACSKQLAWQSRARLVGVSRLADDANALVVHYDKPPSDDDLRALHTGYRTEP